MEHDANQAGHAATGSAGISVLPAVTIAKPRRKPAKGAVSAPVAGELAASASTGVSASAVDVKGSIAAASKSVSASKPGDNKTAATGSAGGVSSVSGVTGVRDLRHLVSVSAPPAITLEGAYELQREFSFVKHLVEADEPDFEDPLYDRYTEYLDRVNNLNIRLAEMAARRYANDEVMAVAPAAPAALARFGRLVGDKENDIIELHTADAIRLYIGFEPDFSKLNEAGMPRYPIDGAVRVGNCLREITGAASRYANPYAEFALMQVEGLFAQLETAVVAVQDEYSKRMTAGQQYGMRFGVMSNPRPEAYPLGFGGPYGFKMAALVGRFDYVRRVMYTATVRGLATKDEERNQLLKLKTQYRSVYSTIVKMAMVFRTERARQVNRADWIFNQMALMAEKAAAGSRSEMGQITLGRKPVGVTGGSRITGEDLNQMLRAQAITRCERFFGVLPRALLLGDEKPAYASAAFYSKTTPQERVLMLDVLGKRSL